MNYPYIWKRNTHYNKKRRALSTLERGLAIVVAILRSKASLGMNRRVDVDGLVGEIHIGADKI